MSQQGNVIAMDPRTGEVLSLVSYPSYDNSRFARAIDGEYYLEIVSDPLRPLVNNTIKSKYPPGSVWKVITAAGVLEENVIDPNTWLLDQGQILVENRYAPNDRAASQRFVCWLRSGHGRVDMIRGIAWSCDVYFYQIGGGNPNLSAQTIRPRWPWASMIYSVMERPSASAASLALSFPLRIPIVCRSGLETAQRGRELVDRRHL